MGEPRVALTREELRQHLKESIASPLWSLPPSASSLNFARWKHYNLDEWYKSIEEYTFETVIIPISFEDARAIFRIGLPTAAKNFPQHRITEEEHQLDLKLLSLLEEKLHTVITSFGEAFVRLSSLSPKDAVLNDTERLKPIIYRELCTLKDSTDITQVERALVTSIGKSLKVVSGKDALNLLTHSPRIRSDLNWFLDMGKQEYTNNIIVRKWFNIPIESEFRGLFSHFMTLSLSSLECSNQICMENLYGVALDHS